jgi:hypothetical protein
MDPVVGSVASAMMTALPLPYAVTIPPGDPGVGVGFVALGASELTGNVLGNEELQATELVRSRTFGVVANVPIARKLPVSCRLPTLMALGTTESDSSGSGAGVDVTVTAALADATVPSAFVRLAVIVVVPALTPVTTPLHAGKAGNVETAGAPTHCVEVRVSPEVTVATVGTLEVQVMLDAGLK